ncbi:glycosyltransferase family 4 protein [Bradyrhizobium sp. JYMT SZCCT0428]|uniref:glycosyltransferase family 4 protein n=1 Tax=Bradyrhizobium sp. JYMT SZCCT0428 TaxID=2807673 RepID=UPI0020117600|nr:glycosyltransferase family 4 protein [Bradyrhizobium sp. JYMT SZCCT0428]
MKILYLSPYFWPEEIGSAPYSTELAVWLQEQGHALQVVAFRPHYPRIEDFGAWSGGTRDQEVLGKVMISRVPVTARGAGGFKDRLKNDVRFLFGVWWRAMRGKFRDIDVTVAYVPTILTLFAALPVKWLTRSRMVAIVHDIESGLASSLGLASNRLVLSVMRFVERLALNRADHVVVLTEGMKSELQKIGCRRPISVISIWATPAPEVAIHAASPVKLMYSGNFGKKQNLDQLVPLIKRLSDERCSIRVVMQGDGSEKGRLEGLFQDAGISNTEFGPLVPFGELVGSLQSASIHLVPQALNVANYALPSKLFSIMSAGRPFVCIAEPGSPLDLLTQKSGAGLCIPPNEEGRLFEEIVSLAGDIDGLREKGRNGRAYVSSYMNKEAIMQMYHAILLGADSNHS